MRLEVEGRQLIDEVTASQLQSALRCLRSYGPSSYASLTRVNGDYVQVAGGGVGCMIERREASTGRHFRAFRDRQHPVFSDGTILSFGGGKIPLQSDEWFNITDVQDVFFTFLNGLEFPEAIKWRDMSALLGSSKEFR